MVENEKILVTRKLLFNRKFSEEIDIYDEFVNRIDSLCEIQERFDELGFLEGERLDLSNFTDEQLLDEMLDSVENITSIYIEMNKRNEKDE